MKSCNNDEYNSLDSLFFPKENIENFSRGFISGKQAIPLFSSSNNSFDSIKQEFPLSSGSTVINQVQYFPNLKKHIFLR